MKSSYNAPPAAERPAPQRTCVACRRVRAKREMMRLVRTPKGSVEIDATGKKEGRGAYICPDRACWEKALKGKQLEHALKGTIMKDDVTRLFQEGKDHLKELIGG